MTGTVHVAAQGLPAVGGAGLGRVAGWQRALVVIGVVSAVAACAFIAARWHPFLLVVEVPLALATAIPLLFRGARRFRSACWWVAGTLLLVQLPLIYFGVAFFLPGAVLLTLATVGRLRLLPLGIRTAAIVLLGVLMVTGWSYGVYTTFVADRDMYLVEVPADAAYPAKELLWGDGSGIGFGADNVFTSDGRVWVGYRADLSQAQRQQLERRLSEIMPPGSRIISCYGQRCS